MSGSILYDDCSVVFCAYALKFPFDFHTPDAAVFTDTKDGNVVS
jgi:hypothetical protein